MRTFRFNVKHDDGEFIMSTVATDEQTARFMICEAEKCPDRALTLLTE